jgi:hypothetical protein
MSNKVNSFSPEGFETALYQDGRLAFRSPDNSFMFKAYELSDDRFNPGMAWRFISSSTTASRYADPCRFYWNKEGKSTWWLGMSISNWNGSSAFSAQVAVNWGWESGNLK